MANLNYRTLLETNNYLRSLSDTTYWLCITRTVQESKLFPMNPYMLVSYLNSFYRLPTLLREIDAATPAEELGDRAREVSLKVDTVNAAWGMPAFYLIGREMLMNWGLLRPTDAVDDVVDVLDFSRRFNLAYHRNDGHLTNKEFGDRSQFLPERTLQVFESDLHGVVPGDRLHTAATKLVAQLSQYAFLAHCECRIGLHNSGPYDFGNNRQMIMRDFFDLTEGDYPWLDGIATQLPFNNLTIPIVFKGTNFHLMDDWASFEAEPGYNAANIEAVGMYTSDALTDGYIPVGMDNADRLADTMEQYREILNEATTDLWKRIATWSREQMIDAGAGLLLGRQGLRSSRRNLPAGRLVPGRRTSAAVQASAQRRIRTRQPRRDGGPAGIAPPDEQRVHDGPLLRPEPQHAHRHPLLGAHR